MSSNLNTPLSAKTRLTSITEIDSVDTRAVVELADLVDDVLEGFGRLDSDGRGVDVALIDTGIAPVDGLDGPDKFLHGPDLSAEGASADLAHLDNYGHGTHMAGIIAGERAGSEGIAPGARLVSLKVAGRDGATSIPQVVAAIDWVVEYGQSHGLNIRVLNLSLSYPGADEYLSAALDRAWRAGIFVVIAAGNRGTDLGHLDSPATNPRVLAVGAVDSTSGVDESQPPVADWSSRGDGVRNPDLVAPGRSIASYRVSGSTIDTDVPSARFGNGFFLGTGTSQAAAVVSGVAARMFAQYPDMDNEQLKQTMRRSATTHLDFGPEAIGEGVLDARNAYENPVYGAESGAEGASLQPAGATWSGATWSGATWSGATWSGATWSGATWSGATWSGATWSGATWS